MSSLHMSKSILISFALHEHWKKLSNKSLTIILKKWRQWRRLGTTLGGGDEKEEDVTRTMDESFRCDPLAARDEALLNSHWLNNQDGIYF